MAMRSGSRVGNPVVVGRHKEYTPDAAKYMPAASAPDDATRAAARIAAAQWALTQPDPEDALAEVLAVLGLDDAIRPARKPGHCACGNELSFTSARSVMVNRREQCSACKAGGA